MGAGNFELTGIPSSDRPDGSEALNRSLVRLLIFFSRLFPGGGGGGNLALYSGYYNAVPTVSVIQCVLI
jgi:hypothetical protein